MDLLLVQPDLHLELGVGSVVLLYLGLEVVYRVFLHLVIVDQVGQQRQKRQAQKLETGDLLYLAQQNLPFLLAILQQIAHAHPFFLLLSRFLRLLIFLIVLGLFLLGSKPKPVLLKKRTQLNPAFKRR